MDLSELITPDGVLPSLRAKNKKQALMELSDRAASLTGLESRSIFEALWQRERLGSTGIGRGIAIPHGKLARLSRMISLFARLDAPIAFESIDDEPVDLIFLLLAPEGAGADHLKALARISRLLRDPDAIRKLRASKDRAALFSVLTEPLATGAS